jgi:hypothetical protein
MKQPMTLEIAAVILTLYPNAKDPMRQPRQVLTETGEVQVSQLSVKNSRWTESRRTIDGEQISVATVTPEILCQLHADLTRHATRPKHVTRLQPRTNHYLVNAAD